MKDDILALVAGALGAWVGYVLFFWLHGQGFYAVILPGSLVGFIGGIFRPRHLAAPIVCGLMAFAAGIFTEWRFAPFVADESFGYFVSHIGSLRMWTLISIAIGTFIGFWVPFTRGKDAKRK